MKKTNAAPQRSDATNEHTPVEDLDPNKSYPIAAIDIGSNSFHLVTARVSNGAIQPLVTEKQIVRLADGLDENGILSEEAIERGLNVLKNFARVIEDIPPESVRAVATYTLRRAANANTFLKRSLEFFPVPIEIISGDEEARLIYQGLAHSMHHEGKRLIVDIGGGSTEFAIGDGFSVYQLSSQPLGCIVFTKRFFQFGDISLEAFEAAEMQAQRILEIIYRRYRDTGWSLALGSSGTIKAIAQYLKLDPTKEESKLTYPLLVKVRDELVAAAHTENIDGVDEHRRKVLPAGLAILIAIFREFDIEEMGICSAALREGVLYELPERMRHHDIRIRTVDSLVLRYDVDTQQVTRILETSKSLFEPFAENLKPALQETARDFLRWSIRLHEIGLQINRRGIQRHSAYIVQNASLPGFNNEEQQALAYMLFSFRKSFQIENMPEVSLMPTDTLFWLTVILRLSILLNIRRLDDFLPEITPEIGEKSLRLKFPKGWLAENRMMLENLKTEAEILSSNGIALSWN